MDDKIKMLYDVYMEKGLLSPQTSLDQFSKADDGIINSLYQSGIDNKIISSETNIETFKTAWQQQPVMSIQEYIEQEDVKKKDVSVLESGTSVGFETPTQDISPSMKAMATPEREVTTSQILEDIQSEEERLEYIKDETRPEYEALKDRLSMVDIANKPEEKLVPELNYLFEDYGFKFEEAKAGKNAVKVIAPNGQEKVIDYGTIAEQIDASGLIMEKGIWARLEEAMFGASEGYEDELKKFIKENRKLNENIDLEKKKFITDKDVKDFTNNFNRDAKVYVSEYKALQQEAEDISNRYKNVTPGTEQYNNYLEEVKVFEGKQKRLNELNTKLREQGKNYDKYVGEYAAMRVEQGSVYGQIIDSAKSGLGGAAAFLTDISITAGGSLIGVSDETLKEFKYGEEEKFVNPFSGKATSISRDMDKGTVERVKDLALIGGRMSSKEYLEDVQQADLFSGKGMLNVLYGVAEFVPATALAGAAGTVALSGQYVMEEMNDNPKFDNISEVEKAGVALAIGAVVGKLEQVGFKNIMESKLLGPISTQIATKVLRRNPATMRTFNEYVEQEVKSLMAKGALKMGAGFVAEFETGAAQEFADILLKGVYNEVKGSELFDTPDDVLNQIIMGGIAEGMGGAYMATPGAMSTALKKNQLSEVDNATFDIFEQMSKDSEYLNMVTNKLDQQVVNQEITKEDRDRILSDYNRLNGAMQKMPDGIKTSQKKQLLGLYMEHQKITDAMKGNDDVFNKRAKEEKLNIEKRIDGLLKENKIETDVEETLNTQPEETKVFYAEKLEDIPEQHRDNATLVENDGSEITFREKTLGLPIGKERKVNVGEYYTYTLNGNEIEQVVEAETETETVDESQDSLLDSLAKEIASKLLDEDEKTKGEISDFPAQRKVLDALDTEVEIDGKKGFLKQDGERIIFETTEVDPEVQKEIDRLESSKRRTEKSEKMRGFDVSKAQLNKQYDEQIAKLKQKSRKRQVDLGNKNDIMFSPLSDIGATETQLSEVEKITFEGKKFKAPPIQTTKGDYISGEMELVSSKVDKKGRRIVTVSYTPKGKEIKQRQGKKKPTSNRVKRKFTGETADQIIKAFKSQQPEPKGGFFSKRPPQGTVKVSDNVAVIGGDSKLSPSKKAKYDRIVNMAQKAIDALSGVFPDLKILIHTNESTFEEEIGDIARGAFKPATNTIHINLALAKSTTVGHEVLHAILVNRLKRDRKIAIAVNKMIDSIKKSVPKDVAEELDAFVENYKGSMKNEEYIAELFGILSDRYNSLPNKAKRAIRDFIRAIQDLFNLPKSATIRDQEVFDFITTMARKVGQGEIVQESDLALIEDVDKEVKAKVRKEEPEVRKQKVNPKIEKLKEEGLYDGILDFISAGKIDLSKQLLKGAGLTFEEFQEGAVEEMLKDSRFSEVIRNYFYDYETQENVDTFVKSTFKRKDPKTGEPTTIKTDDGYPLVRLEGGQYTNGDFTFESFNQLTEDSIGFGATELTSQEEAEVRNRESFKEIEQKLKDTPSIRQQKFDKKTKKDEKETKKPQTRLQKANPVQEFIKNARAKGVTVSQIKDYLKRKKGYTQAEVDALFPKPKKKKKHTKKSIIDLINQKAKNTKKGNVSVRTTNSLLKKAEKLDYTNEKSVEAFAERVAKIYDRAGTIQEINTAKSNRTKAKKNLSKSKLGASARGFVDAANKILSIKVDFIPIELLEEYNEVMAPLAKREKVKIIDIDTAKMQDLLVKIQEEMEEIAEAEVEKNPTKAEKNRKDNIKNIKSRRGKIKPNLSNKFDNDFAEFLLGITDAQLEEMSAANIDVLKNLYSQIEQGYLSTSLASEIKKEVDGKIEGGGTLLGKLNLKKAGKFYVNSMAKIYTKLRGVFSDDTNLLTLIRSTALTEIDTLLGNFNAKDIYNKTFGKLASAKEKYDFDLANIMAKLDKFNDLISGGKVFKALNNQQLKSKFRIMASLLQDEFEANPGAKGVASAIEYIDATVKKLERGGKKDRMEADILLELKKEIEDKGISLSEREVKGKKILQEINNDISEKFMFVAALRGQTPRIYNSYIHHSALYSLDNQQSLVESQSNALMNPSTKAGTINERSGNKVISFDPAFSTLQGVKQTLLDFHMTQPLKEVRASIAVLENSDKKDVREVGIALDKALKEALEIVLSHNLSYYGMAEKTLDNIRRLSYYATLASVPRAAAELGSNMSYALLSNPKSFTLGSTKYKYLSLNVNGAKLMNQVGSTITTKNYSKESLSGSRADSATFNRSAFNNSKPKGRIKEVMQFIAENTLVGPLAVKATNVIAEKLISTPDLAVARPLWFGTFFGELESLTGKKFSKKQILEMAEGKSPLLKTYKKEVEQARVKADRENVQMSGSSNAFDSILKDQIRNTGKKSSTLLNMYRVINTYMARFVKNEYNTFKSAIYALFNSGDISRPQAIALTVAVTTRMTGYMVLYTMFKDMFFSAFDDDDDEKDTDYGELATRQLAGSFVTLMTRRSLGNIPYLPIALASEYVNENHLEDLRNGKDYDPFENSLIYSPVNLTDLKSKEPYDIWLAAFGGPFSPMLKSASRMQKVVTRMHTSRTEETKEKYRTEFKERMLLELAGNFGLVPFYKDIRTAKLKKLFEDSGNKKSKFTFTDAEKKKYMPELYKMEKQIEKEFKRTEEYKELKKMKAQIKKEREEMLKSMFE